MATRLDSPRTSCGTWPIPICAGVPASGPGPACSIATASTVWCATSLRSIVNCWPMPKKPLLVISLIALLHAAAYIVHQRPDWEISWTDQSGYIQLGRALATTGSFTRVPNSAEYVPEAIRTPGYPAFLALIYLVFGTNNQMAVAI